MRHLALSLTVATACMTPLVLADTAEGQTQCAPGYIASGLLCVPDPNYRPPAVAAPAPVAPVVPAPSQGGLLNLGPVVDRATGRNFEPVPGQTLAPIVAPPANPTPPGGNANNGGDNGILGQVGVLPGGGTCSPGAVIVILGTHQTCPPAGTPVVVTQPPSSVYVTPAPSPRVVTQYSLPVTH